MKTMFNYNAKRNNNSSNSVADELQAVYMEAQEAMSGPYNWMKVNAYTHKLFAVASDHGLDLSIMEDIMKMDIDSIQHPACYGYEEIAANANLEQCYNLIEVMCKEYDIK